MAKETNPVGQSEISQNDQVEQAQQDSETPPTGQPEIQQDKKRKKPRKGIWIAIGIAILVILGVAFYFLWL